MGDFCHFYKFFLCTHNPESQPLRSLGDLSMNILSCLLLNWKNAECRLPAVHLPNSYPFLSHFSVSPILSSTPSEKGAYGFQGWPATLHLTASTRILPPWTLHSLPPLVCFFPIALCCTFPRARLSEQASACSSPWKAGPAGLPGAAHHLPCSPVFCALDSVSAGQLKPL